MTDSHKNVLIISYFYPPAGGAGSIRITKFVKYLPHFGWSPIVLTTKDPESPLRDESLGEEIPDGTVTIRTFSIEPTKWKIKKIISDSAVRKEPAKHLSKISHRFRSLVKGFVNRWLFIPDSRIGWIPFAVWAGLLTIKRNNISVVMASGTPWSSLVIGALLSRLAKIPLVTDFRDGWIRPFVRSNRLAPRQKIDAMLENFVIRQSAAVVCVNESTRNAYLEKCAHLPSGKIHVITNGFDEDDFRGLMPQRSKSFKITYSGSFNDFQRALPFLKGLRRAVEQQPGMQEDLEVAFIGSIGTDDIAAIKKLGLAKYISLTNYVTHRKIPELLFQSSVLLLVLFKGPGSDIFIPCKTFEYLRTGIPILAIAPEEGPTARLIIEAGAGKVVNPQQTDAIADAIIEFYRGYQQMEYAAMPRSIAEDGLERFERRHQASVLADLLGRTLQPLPEENRYPV